MKSERVSYKRRRAANNYTMNERERGSRKERRQNHQKKKEVQPEGTFKKNISIRSGDSA